MIGGEQTVVYPSTDEAGESEGTVEDTVGSIRQSDVLDASSSQVS